MKTSILTPITEVQFSNEPAIKTGNIKLDNLLSKDGGIKKGITGLYSGTSGSGKSTLMVFVMSLISETSAFFSVEMPASQLREQTKNIEFPNNNAYIVDTDNCKSLESFLEATTEAQAKFIVIDSIQAACKLYPNLSEDAASVHIIDTVREWAKKNDAAAIIIAHNTKDGNFAGGNYLKQMTDLHLVSEYNKKTKERRLFTEKNRKGPVMEYFYEFSNTGIEFFTEEEINVKKGNLHYGDSIMESSQNFLSMFCKTLTEENLKEFKKEYRKAVQKIEKIEDYNIYLLEVVGLINDLTVKYSPEFVKVQENA